MSPSPFPSPKSSLAQRRNVPTPLDFPSSPLLFSPPIPQNSTLSSSNSTKRIDRSWSLASIPIFLDQGEGEDEGEGESGGGGSARFLRFEYFSSDDRSPSPTSRSSDRFRPSKAHLIPEDVEHEDTAYSAAPIPSPRRAYRLGPSSSSNNNKSRRAPLTPNDEDARGMMLRRNSAASSATDSSTSGGSTGTMVGLGMRRDESDGAISLAGTFGGRKGSLQDDFNEEDDLEFVEKREADRMSMFSLSEYYGREDEGGSLGGGRVEEEDEDKTGRQELLDDDWNFGRPINPPPMNASDERTTSLDIPFIPPSNSSKTIVPRSDSPSPSSSPNSSPSSHLRRSKPPPPPLTTLRPRSPSPNLPDFLRSAPSTPDTPSPSPAARSNLSLPSAAVSASNRTSTSSYSSTSTPDGKVSGHRPSSSYSGPRNSRSSMLVQQGREISIDIWIDQEGFRAIRPRLSFTRYSPPSPSASLSSSTGTPQKQQGHQRARSSSFGSGNRNSTDMMSPTGFFEFGMKKRQSWAFHHAVLDKSPVLRRLTLSDDDSKDFLSRQGDLSVRSNGVYTLKGSEDKGTLEWKFEYEVYDRISSAGKILAGEKVLTPISFSCAPDLLDRSRGKKPGFLSVVKKTVVLPNLMSEKLEAPCLPSLSSPTYSSGSSPLSSTVSLGASAAAKDNQSSSLSRTMDAIAKAVSSPSNGSSSRPTTPSAPTSSRPGTPSSRTRQPSQGAYLSVTPPLTAPLPLPSDAASKLVQPRKRSASLSARLRPFTPPSTSPLPPPTIPAEFVNGSNPHSRGSSSHNQQTAPHAFGTSKRVVAVAPLPFIPPAHPPPAQPELGGGRQFQFKFSAMGLGSSMGMSSGASRRPGGVLKGSGKGRPATADNNKTRF